jgi:hypothetical protein
VLLASPPDVYSGRRWQCALMAYLISGAGMMDKVGILAYGSLIGEPGPEIEPSIVRRIACVTPFKVEFARASKTRTGGPSLVPYEAGAQVDDRSAGVTLDEAPDGWALHLLRSDGTGRISDEPGYRRSASPPHQSCDSDLPFRRRDTTPRLTRYREDNPTRRRELDAGGAAALFTPNARARNASAAASASPKPFLEVSARQRRCRRARC